MAEKHSACQSSSCPDAGYTWCCVWGPQTLCQELTLQNSARTVTLRIAILLWICSVQACALLHCQVLLKGLDCPWTAGQLALGLLLYSIFVLFELARPVLRKLQHLFTGSFTLLFWTPYLGFQIHICQRITRLKRFYFCLFLILVFFSLSFLISRQEAWGLQRTWSSCCLNSSSSEPHTLMWFFSPILGRFGGRISVQLLARALMNYCIETDSDKRPSIFFSF